MTTSSEKKVETGHTNTYLSGPWRERFNGTESDIFDSGGRFLFSCSRKEAAVIVTAVNQRAALVEALRVTRGNILSLGPAGALGAVPMEYREWLAVVEQALVGDA